MKNSEINKMSAEQLQAAIANEKALLKKMQFGHAITPLQNPLRIRNSRRSIARLLTALNAAK